MEKIRVRFAPSPTGPLHIGGLRTALFNYLFARKHDGVFILRIEDTDQNRYIPGAEDYIMNALDWCGIAPDEGPGPGGSYGPYRQSERKEAYRDYAQKLIDSGDAYYAFDTPGELEEMRKAHELRKETFTYDSHTRGQMKNSISLPEDEVSQLIDSGTPYVIRYRFEENTNVVMNDLIRGEVSVDTGTLDDKILFKSDGMPTYHLANVVDDHLMNISHVIRGEEWLPSLPLHVSLYRSLGWADSMPAFAHLPLILKPDGKGKLSKRDGDKGGFPVFPLEWHDPKSGDVSAGYREEGYFAEAVVNLLAFLGWNPGTEKELYSLEELTRDFDLDKVGRSGARFDPEKARWFNHHYLQERTVAGLAEAFVPVLKEHGVQADASYVESVVALVRERADFVSDFWEQSFFLFREPQEYDEKVVRKRWKEDTPALMRSLGEVLEGIGDFKADKIEETVKSEIAKRGWGMGAVMNAWRLLLVGTSMGPSLFQIAELIGKDEVLSRINRGIKTLESQ